MYRTSQTEISPPFKRKCCGVPPNGDRFKNRVLATIVGAGLCVSVAVWVFVVGPRRLAMRSLRPDSLLPSPDDETTVTLLPERAAVRQTLYVGVLTFERHATTRAAACSSTWGRSALIDGIEYFAQLGPRKPHDIAPPIINLTEPVTSDYAHQRKSFLMLEHICARHVDEYDWFVRAVDDVYIDVPRLYSLLSKFDTRKSVYAGHPSQAITDIGYKVLGTSSYCLGGAPIIFSRHLMKRLCRHVPSCRDLYHDAKADVEIARCIKTYIGLECAASDSMRNHFYNSYEGNQFDILEAFTEKRHVISLHPVKSTWLMSTLHRLHLSRIYAKLTDKLRTLLDSQQQTLRKLGRKSAPAMTSFIDQSMDYTYAFDGNRAVYSADVCKVNAENENTLQKEFDVAVRFANASCRLGSALHCPTLVGGYSQLTDHGAVYVVDLRCSHMRGGTGTSFVRVKMYRNATCCEVTKHRRRIVRRPLVAFTQVEFSQLPLMVDFLLHMHNAAHETVGRYALYMLLTSHESSSSSSIGVSEETNDLISDMKQWYFDRGFDIRIFVTSQSQNSTRVTKSVLRDMRRHYGDATVFVTSPNVRFNSNFLQRCRVLAREGIHAYQPYASEQLYANEVTRLRKLHPSMFEYFWTNRAAPLCAHITDIYTPRKGASYEEKRKAIKITRAFDTDLTINH